MNHQYANKSLFVHTRTSGHYFLLPLQQMSCGVIRNFKGIIYTCPKFLKGTQIMMAEKIWQKSHHIYLPEITKTCFLGRPQKKLLEHNGCLQIAPTLEQRVTEPEMENVPSLENYFPRNCRSFTPMLSKALEQQQDKYVSTYFCRPGKYFFPLG